MEGFKPQDFSFFHCGEKLVQPFYRIKATDFGQIYMDVSHYSYAAREIEEWLCNEHDEIMKI